jgi:16S rRNA (cytidine1402-2'-O)-methyltransferase
MHSGDRLGCIYVVATPIGNLEDITLRALKVLKEADIIACEDTRQTLKLLNRYEIKAKKLVSYHQHNEKKVSERLINEVLEGKTVALVSDAGTPCISDPGAEIVRKARERNIKVLAVPGPSAVCTAVSVSGFPGDSFEFLGFLPRTEEKLKTAILRAVFSPLLTVCFESPHRIKTTMQFMKNLVPDAEIVVLKELTKLNESYLKGKPSELCKLLEGETSKGEFVLMFPPNEEFESPEEILSVLKEKGLSMKEAVRITKEVSGRKRGEIYALAVEIFK